MMNSSGMAQLENSIHVKPDDETEPTAKRKFEHTISRQITNYASNK